MTFQFLCPQGHLLEGDEAHMGMECECPQCGTAFIIPVVDQPAAGASPAHVPASPQRGVKEQHGASPSISPLADLEAAAASTMPTPAQTIDEELESLAGAGQTVEEVLLHIPCPNGHVLETPYDMLGQRALCPHCGAQFKLKREKSMEHIREVEARERAQAQFWFKMAMVAAGFVIVVVLAMIAIVAAS